MIVYRRSATYLFIKKAESNSSAMTQIMTIESLPKIELHRHLDCSMRFKKMVEIAKKLDLKIPDTIDQQKDYFLIKKPMNNLAEVIDKFLRAEHLLYSEEVLEQLAFDVVSEVALENTKLIELRYAPTVIESGHGGLSWDPIHESILRGIQKAQVHFDIEVGLIIIIQRTLPLSLAKSVVDFAINHKSTLVGIDLADKEDGFDAKAFEPLFLKAKKSDLNITVHAGEVPTSSSIQNMEDAILRLGAQRIGHGIQAIHSPPIMDLLRKHNICLEVCPTSNYLTQSIPQLDHHPLKDLINNGVQVTLNTDDPGIFDYTLTDELHVAHQVLGCSLREIQTMQRWAFESSFIPQEKKQRFSQYFLETK